MCPILVNVRETLQKKGKKKESIRGLGEFVGLRMQGFTPTVTALETASTSGAA